MPKETTEKQITDTNGNTFNRGPVICTAFTPELGLLVAPTQEYHAQARYMTKPDLDYAAAFLFDTAPDYFKPLKKELVACAVAARFHELGVPSGAN